MRGNASHCLPGRRLAYRRTLRVNAKDVVMKKRKGRIFADKSKSGRKTETAIDNSLLLPKRDAIGIIGWNSPKFANTHSEFIELLKKSISLQGGSPQFFGISGPSDFPQATERTTRGESAQPSDRHSSIEPVSMPTAITGHNGKLCPAFPRHNRRSN